MDLVTEKNYINKRVMGGIIITRNKFLKIKFISAKLVTAVMQSKP